ncbi:MAG: BrnT family toxin [Desulfobacterales bacterium]
MKFEFDSKKSERNKIKHGIDFTEAQTLWEDPDRLLIPARTIDETRFLLIGKILEKHWSAIFTIRGDAVRLISVRRCREEEVEIYES